MKNTMWMALSLSAGLLSAACGEPSREPTEPAREEAVVEQRAEEQRVEQPVEPASPEAPEVATVGQPAPDFTLTDQAGAEHRLSQYRGRIVVLEWINPECPYVQRHYRARTMTTLEQALPDDQVVWLAIDSSNFVRPEDSQAWRTEHAMAYPVLQDPAGTVGRLYAARTTPHMYVIDAEGTLRYAGGIDDDPRGQSSTPTNHVERAVRALMSGEPVPAQTTEPYGCTVKYQEA